MSGYQSFEPQDPGSNMCRLCGRAAIAHDAAGHCPIQPPACKHGPADPGPQVRALVSWVRMYIEQDGFVTLEQREQARAALEPFKGVE